MGWALICRASARASRVGFDIDQASLPRARCEISRRSRTAKISSCSFAGPHGNRIGYSVRGARDFPNCC